MHDLKAIIGVLVVIHAFEGAASTFNVTSLAATIQTTSAAPRGLSHHDFNGRRKKILRQQSSRTGGATLLLTPAEHVTAANRRFPSAGLWA